MNKKQQELLEQLQDILYKERKGKGCNNDDIFEIFTKLLVKQETIDIFKLLFGISTIICFNVLIIFGVRWLLYLCGIGLGLTYNLNWAIAFVVAMVVNYMFYRSRK